jgi:hypothetical protein
MFYAEWSGKDKCYIGTVFELLFGMSLYKCGKTSGQIRR